MDEPASYRSRCAVIGPTAPVEILRRRLYNEGDISLVITRPAPRRICTRYKVCPPVQMSPASLYMSPRS